MATSSSIEPSIKPIHETLSSVPDHGALHGEAMSMQSPTCFPTTAPCGVPSRWKLLDCSKPSACAATESVDAADAAAISAVLVGGLRWKWEGEHKHREREGLLGQIETWTFLRYEAS